MGFYPPQVARGRLQWVSLALGSLFAVTFPTVYYHPESFLTKGPCLQDGTSENATSGPGILGSEDYICHGVICIYRCYKGPKFPIGFESGKPVV